MPEINSVFIIGSDENTQKIISLFSKAGFRVNQAEDKPEAEFSSAVLVIEAVPGGLEQKIQALLDFEGKITAEAILATTVTGGVTAVASGTNCPERTIGLHFIFNPFEDKCLVEIAKGLDTSPKTMETCRSAMEKTGAVPVYVEDISGLITDRVMASVINEAAVMYDTKLASLEDINRVPKLCLNWPMGPFEFADLIGIDNIVAILEDASRDGPQYLPCRLLRRMTAAGRLGRKTGRGFYDYTGKA